MSNRILVAYASQTGSTAGVAEAIGKTLAEDGGQVEVCLMKDVRPRPLLSPDGRQRRPQAELVARGHAVYADSICDIGSQALSLYYKRLVRQQNQGNICFA